VESGSHEKVIKDFRQRMTVRKEQADAGRHMSGILGTACGVLTVAVLAGGVVLVNNYHKMRQMESVLTSVVPAGSSRWRCWQEVWSSSTIITRCGRWSLC
jgi:tetrahydromethanopterin S-methyltransferase subunit F